VALHRVHRSTSTKEIQEMSNNTLRVLRASAALRAYVQAYVEDDVDSTATDLITDLMHFIANQGRNPIATLEMAKMHFHAEVLEEAGEESDGECAFNSNGVCTVCGLKDKRG